MTEDKNFLNKSEWQNRNTSSFGRNCPSIPIIKMEEIFIQQWQVDEILQISLIYISNLIHKFEFGL